MDGASYAISVDSCHKLGFQLQQFFNESPLIITPATCGHAPKLEGDGFVNGEETPSWVRFYNGHKYDQKSCWRDPDITP